MAFDPIAKLEELEGRMTPGPWGCTNETVFYHPAGRRGTHIALFSGEITTLAQDLSNAKSSVITRNALPHLLAYVRALEDYYERADGYIKPAGKYMDAVDAARSRLAEALGGGE